MQWSLRFLAVVTVQAGWQLQVYAYHV